MYLIRHYSRNEERKLYMNGQQLEESFNDIQNSSTWLKVIPLYTTERRADPKRPPTYWSWVDSYTTSRNKVEMENHPEISGRIRRDRNPFYDMIAGGGKAPAENTKP